MTMPTNEETHEEANEIPEAQPMKWRQVAGEINRARRVFVYVCWGPGADGEDYYPISKEGAREIVDHAKEAQLDIYVAKNGRNLYIGPCDEEEEEGELEGPDDEPEPEPSEEEEEGGEE